MVKQEDLIENLDADIAECLLRFEVNDPYETCFGYLCLIEAGSDIPWTYNAAVAVLMAAARKLPWNARALDELDDLTDGFDEESDSEYLHENADGDFARDKDIGAHRLERSKGGPISTQLFEHAPLRAIGITCA